MYYNTRSQPPLLVEMVASYLATRVDAPPCNLEGREAHEAIYQHTKDVMEKISAHDRVWLNAILPTLLQEYFWWGKNRFVELQDPATGTTHLLNHYCVIAEGARPEMHQIDSRHAADMGHDQKLAFWSKVQTACESGWDFSSRWDWTIEEPVIPVRFLVFCFVTDFQ